LAQPVTQSVTQNVTQTVASPIASPIAPRLAQPVTQSVTQPVTHAVAQLVAPAVTPSVTVSASLPLDRSVVVDSPDCIADSPTITARDANTVVATESVVAIEQKSSLPIPAVDSESTASPSGCTDTVCLDGEATDESTLPDSAARLTEEGGPSTAGPGSSTESAQPQATHRDGSPVPSAASTQHTDAPTAKSPGQSSPVPTPTDAGKGAALVRSQDPFVQSWRSIKHFVAHMTDIDVMVFTSSLPMFRSFLSMLRALTPFYKGPTVSLDELIEAAGEAPG
jgi:hypothetical protein